MVDPISTDDRARTLRWAKAATVVLVGLSAGLITTQGDTSLEVVAASIGGGVVLGIVLVWFLFPEYDDIAPAEAGQYRR